MRLGTSAHSSAPRATRAVRVQAASALKEASLKNDPNYKFAPLINVRGYEACLHEGVCAVAECTGGKEQLQAGAIAVALPSPTSTPWMRASQGCWQLAGGHGREVFDGIQEKLEAHADAGLTTFDTADIYGPSEGGWSGGQEPRWQLQRQQWQRYSFDMQPQPLYQDLSWSKPWPRRLPGLCLTLQQPQYRCAIPCCCFCRHSRGVCGCTQGGWEAPCAGEC